MNKPVRTRFAPSPTGFLHVGNVRSALFPWLIAKQAGGTFILRVEDTDQAREVEGAVDVMHETLNWIGIEWDEGPNAKVVSSRGVGSNFCPSANIVIDGMPNQSINDVNPFMVGSVEAYREGEPTPPEYFDHKGCGMIVIWTKR